MISTLRMLPGAILLALLAATAGAEQFRTFDNFDIHYIALNTDFLQPEIARTYGITRSKNRALLNISIIEKIPGTTGRSVAADVRVTSTNLAGQSWPLVMQRINEQEAIYYIAEFPISHADIVKFQIRVTLAGKSVPFEISYKRQFFVH